MSDTEVVLKATQRWFGRDEFLRIMAEADMKTGTCRVTELLNCETICQFQLAYWQKKARGRRLCRE